MRFLFDLGKAVGDDPCDPLGALVRRGIHVRLPDPHDCPARTFERCCRSSVALHVRANFGDPVRGVRSAREALETRVKLAAVPKIAVDEDRDTRTREDDVWSSGQAAAVNSEAEPELPDAAPKGEFAPRIVLPARGTRSHRRTWGRRAHPFEPRRGRFLARIHCRSTPRRVQRRDWCAVCCRRGSLPGRRVPT